MIDARTAVLVTAAIASPWLLQAGAVAGAPIPVYVTAGQVAALAAFGGATIGTTQTDTQSFAARVLAGTGAVPPMTGSEAVYLATRLIAACDAGAAVPKEGYHLQQQVGGPAGVFGYEGGSNPTIDASMPRSDLGNAYDAVKAAMVNVDEFSTDESDGRDLAMLCYALALEMDQQGFQIDGAPTLSIGGGVAAAGDATASWIAARAGTAAGMAAKVILNALTSEIGLVCIAGIVVYKAATR